MIATEFFVAIAVIGELLLLIVVSRLAHGNNLTNHYLEEDQHYCVDEASRLKESGASSYTVDVWLLAACSPRSARKMLYAQTMITVLSSCAYDPEQIRRIIRVLIEGVGPTAPAAAPGIILDAEAERSK